MFYEVLNFIFFIWNTISFTTTTCTFTTYLFPKTLKSIPVVLFFALSKVFTTFFFSLPNSFRFNSSLSMQMKEMIDFTRIEYTSDITYDDSPDEDDYDLVIEPEQPSISSNRFTEEQVCEMPQICPLTNSTVKDYYSKAGVAIMPEIPEEAEEMTDETGGRNFIDPKRISRISAKLEELNQKQYGVEILNISDLVVSKQKIEATEKIENIEYISNYKDNSRHFIADIETIKIRSCCSCPTYRIFTWKRKFRFCKDLLVDNFCKPLFNALKDLHFFPTLVSKVSTSLISMIYITLAPYLALQKNDDFKKEDTAFLLSYVAFSWCLFLVLLPLVVTFNKRKIVSIYVCGLLLCACSLICKYFVRNNQNFLKAFLLYLYANSNRIIIHTNMNIF